MLVSGPRSTKGFGVGRVFELTTATCGTVILVLVWLSVLRTTLIPRGSSSRMARWTTRACAAVAIAIARRLPAKSRERVMEFCAPTALFLMVAAWLTGLAIGFGLLAAAVDRTAGSGVLARFTTPDLSGPAGALVVVAVMSALLVLGLFVAYLVQFMAAYRRRERMNTRSAAQVNLATAAEGLLADHLRAGSRDSLDQEFVQWTNWLADIHGSHTAYPALVYHRPTGRACWTQTAMVRMDAAALVRAVAPSWAPVHAKVLLDVGSECLQDLAARVGIVRQPMKVSLHGREERTFSETMDVAVNAGLPAERDTEMAGTAFQKIRVRYAPYAVLIESRLLSPRSDGEAGTGS